MASSLDLQIAVQWLMDDCKDKKDASEKNGCLTGHLELFKQYPKDFVSMAKRKVAKVM
jgi:hypothetical protein